jgi:transcription initiation factor TFIIIB Brf1 subunit/transcription initiation factor TFIIB
MKCPKCKSSMIAVTKKQGEIACKTCGYVFEEHEAAKFREETKPGKK